MNYTTRAMIRGVLVLPLVLAGVAGAQDYGIEWYTIDGGGEMASTGGDFTLAGTIGQPDAGSRSEPMAGGSYTLTGGFWVIPGCPRSPGDYDQDCDVDTADFALFEACASGPEVSYARGCNDRDFDDDGDVDQGDYGAFQRCYSGADRPADSACAG